MQMSRDNPKQSTRAETHKLQWIRTKKMAYAYMPTQERCSKRNHEMCSKSIRMRSKDLQKASWQAAPQIISRLCHRSNYTTCFETNGGPLRNAKIATLNTQKCMKIFSKMRSEDTRKARKHLMPAWDQKKLNFRGRVPEDACQKDSKSDPLETPKRLKMQILNQDPKKHGNRLPFRGSRTRFWGPKCVPLPHM